nr:HAD hydrolase-like protein [Thermoleophilaceae bacterium]
MTALDRPPAGPAATDFRLRSAVEAVSTGGCEVLSLDFFDTLMWRKVPEPINAFVLFGARLQAEGLLAPDIDASAFALLRERAEQRARQARELDGRGEEVTLREICARIPPAVLRDLTLDGLMGREVELERSLLVPDLDVVELVRLAGEHGVRTVCVSDTYFGEAHLRSFLASGPAGALAIDRVFASSAHGVGKGGGLWRIVLEDLGVKPARVIHVGDNHEADVVAAGRAGVRGIYFERRAKGLSQVVRRENLRAIGPLSPYHGDYGLTALRSKVLHRVEAQSQPPDLKPFWDFGAASMGPPLAGFADWVQERAVEAGVSRVFCMMREGKILSELVNAAGASVAAPVDAQPIWLSRQVCARASIVEGSAEELGRLFVRRRAPKVGEFCATLGVDCAELAEFADLA